MSRVIRYAICRVTRISPLLHLSPASSRLLTRVLIGYLFYIGRQIIQISNFQSTTKASSIVELPTKSNGWPVPDDLEFLGLSHKYRGPDQIGQHSTDGPAVAHAIDLGNP
jgi:hypothetical protein